MLFSEPKIPQSLISATVGDCGRASFSALQRAENSSIQSGNPPHAPLRGFSALQRAENSSIFRHLALSSEIKSFSALQRAENSSIVRFSNCAGSCSSFSALQRAENSSMNRQARAATSGRRVSVLFSEPKIPQLSAVAINVLSTAMFQCSSASRKFLNLIFKIVFVIRELVSVLFSEPKIPQCSRATNLSASC